MKASVRRGNYTRKVPEGALPGMIAAYERGDTTIPQLARRYNVSRQTVWKLFKARGVRVRPRHPKLNDAERSLQLHWLKHHPKYRELIRQRISAEQKRRYKRESTIRYGSRYTPTGVDHDNLGREVEGCG